MNAAHTDILRFIRSVKEKQATGALSDRQLLESFLSQRSEASFTALVQRHGPMVFGVCRRLLRHTQDAEDAFQATFLALARQADSIRRQEALGSWLHGVAYRVAEKMKRTAARRSTRERGATPLPSGDAIDDITWRELRSVLDEELQKMPENYRAPLVLCYLEARTQDEAARRLGWSKNTFGRRMNQARQMLARRLTRRGLTLPAALTAPLLIDGAASAAVPPLLAANTVRAGLAAAMGNTVSGIVSAQVVALAENGVASLLAKKMTVALVLLVSLTLGVGGLLAHRAFGDRTLAEAPAAPKVPQSPLARSASKDKAIEIKGRVLDPEGKPFAGARLLLLSDTAAKKTDIPGRATTDRDGLFRFPAKSTDFDPQGKATLAATAKGLGPDWIEVTTQNKDALTLHLVKDDLPVEGRVLDLEGRPVEGVRVRVALFMQGDVNAWLEGIRQKRYPQLNKRINPEAVGAAAAAVTGKDGRFRLTGFGRDRVLDLRLEGDKIERGDFDVAIRAELPREISKGNNGVYPARFDHLAGPAKSIIGTIRDKRTGKPLAGIRVVCPVTPSWIKETTDAQGRYRLTGIPKREQYWVAAGGLPYFNCTKFDVADTPGLEPVTVDFALERGIAVRGKLLDKVTGKPIRGQVYYIALPDNSNLRDFTDVNNPQALATDPGYTNADGSFTVVAVPGPGLIVATANDRGRYLTAAVPEPKPEIPNVLEGHHAIVRVNPSEKEPQSTTQNLYLEPARTVNGTVVGPDGKPLAGAHYAGLTGTLFMAPVMTPTMESASFTAGGINSKRTRNIVFVHAEKKLAKIQPIGGDTANSLTVRLEPLGAVRGRILDAAGRPRAGLKLTIQYSNQKSDYQDLPLELLHFAPSWSKILNRKATTDAEGRFHAEGLVPGLKYFLVEEPGTFLDPLARGIAVESSKTKDLGDLKIKQPSQRGTKEKP